ncbi:MAG TPA: NADH-quinone oxidoreductase subunit N [Geobacteraceae bacterium]
MILVMFGATLVKPGRIRLYPLALFLALLSLIAALLSFGDQGELFYAAYRVDHLSQLFKVIVTLGLALVIGSTEGVRAIDAKLHPEYHMFLAIGALGLVCLASANELLTIVMSLEISAFALNLIIPFRFCSFCRGHMEAAIKYFLFGVVSTGVMLYGMSYIFGLAHTTQLDELAPLIPNLLRTEPLALIAFVMLLCGFFFKLAMFPLHFLTPDIYEGAANETATILATLPKLAAVAVLIRLMGLTGGDMTRVTWVLACFAVLSMTVGNLSALVQKDLKRLLAYSAIAHAGYVMIALLSVNELGFAAAIYYIAGYLVMNLALFHVIYHLARNGENLTFAGLTGLHRRSPLLAFTLAVGAFGLTGIPPTVGFTGKFLIFTAALQRGYYALVILAVINAAISAFYYLKMVRAAYCQPDEEKEPVRLGLPATLLALFYSAAAILVGALPQGLLTLAKQAVAGMR